MPMPALQMARFRLGVVGLVAALIAAVALAPSSISAQEADDPWEGEIPEEGVSIVTFAGGDLDLLVSSAEEREIISVFATVDGEFVGYIVGAPDFVNTDFASNFEGDIEAGQPFVIRIRPAAAAAQTLEVTGVDYAYQGVPETVEAGTELTFTNASPGEVHELILFRLPEGEERSVEDLLELPDEDAEALVGAPIGVSVAMPEEDGMVLEGDLTVEESGRYLMLCFIPVGADPAVFEEAIQNPEGGPPELEDPGPPHVTQGMYAEFTVE